jgi:hypothetical protein
MKSQMITKVLAALVAMALVACNGANKSSNGSSNSSHSIYAQNPNNFRLSLTDAPNDDLKKVVVKVKYAELRVSGGGKEARVIVAENLGEVNLLDLQNGVTLPMADLAIPEQLSITQIRLVLDSEGNYIIKSDDSRCDLSTPSAEQTGIKLLIQQGITIDKGYSYSVVADFDAKKSVVLQGNTGCLLKPVIKLKSATRVELAPPGEENPGDDGEVVVPDDSGIQSDDGSGFDSGTDESVPEIPGDDVTEFFD